MNTKTILTILSISVLALFMTQCEVVSDDLLEDPNAVQPGNVSPNFLLSNIQLETAAFYQAMSEPGAEVTRILQMFGTSYPVAFVPGNFDFAYTTAYADILIDAETLIPLATGQELFIHAGIARVLRAYTLITLVDNFAQVPFTEALDESNFNPAVDDGATIYSAAIAELDSAIINLGMEAAAVPTGSDLFYGGDADAWITAANSLKLRAFVQMRLAGDNTAAINQMISEGNLIDEPSENLSFPFSTNSANPDSRHPEFTGNYLSGAAEYQSNYFMNELLQDKSVEDPRLRYYVYRQVGEPTTDVNEQQCINGSPPDHYSGTSGDGQGNNDPYCEDYSDRGYWGRDHGLSLGIPPDNFLRTNFGVYPAGGRFDADQAEGVDQSQGLQGAGIHPIYMSFFTDFLLAESALMSGTMGDPRSLLESGVRGSIGFVMDFATGTNPTGTNAVAATGGEDFVPTQNDIDSYVNEVLGRYDSASNDQERLAVIAKEFYMSLYGNGIDAFNLYRRTTFPDNIQPHVETPMPGQFFRTFIYPSALVDRNASVDFKPNEVQVFWDTNPADIFNF